MTKEQEEAIEKLEYYLKNSDFFKNGGWEVVDLEIPKSIETVLNMLKEKDKQIDLMGEVIFKRFAAQLIIEYGIENKEQFIKCFENKVKEDKENE